MRFLAIGAVALAGQAALFKATLTTAGHHPVVNTRWAYSVKATNATGKPIAARATVQIVDPLGTAHPVEFYANHKVVRNIPFRGTFRDAVKWPPDSRNIPLTFRVTVRAGTARRVLNYQVTAR